MCEPRIVTASEGAEVFKVKISTFRDLARRRGWPHYKVGHAVRWDLDEILALAREVES